jgi:hypothetical protein
VPEALSATVVRGYRAVILAVSASGSLQPERNGPKSAETRGYSEEAYRLERDRKTMSGRKNSLPPSGI